MPTWSLKERFRTWWNGLYPEQRSSLLVIGPLGILALFLSVWQLQSHLVFPFRVSRQTLAVASKLTPKNQPEPATQDTDGDGLYDRDEVERYFTSPYLDDTDSDGILDGEEVRLNKNPNCPEGKTCGYGGSEGEVVESTSTIRVSGGANSFAPLPDDQLTTPPLPEEANAENIRRYLLQNGLISTSLLSSLDEAGVLELYRRLYPEIQGVTRLQSQPVTSTSPTPSTTSTASSPQP